MWLYMHEEIRRQWESVGECGGSKNVFNLGRVVFRDFRDEKCGRNAPCMGEWGMGKNAGHRILAYKTEYCIDDFHGDYRARLKGSGQVW